MVVMLVELQGPKPVTWEAAATARGLAVGAVLWGLQTYAVAPAPAVTEAVAPVNGPFAAFVVAATDPHGPAR